MSHEFLIFISNIYYWLNKLLYSLSNLFWYRPLHVSDRSTVHQYLSVDLTVISNTNDNEHKYLCAVKSLWCPGNNQRERWKKYIRGIERFLFYWFRMLFTVLLLEEFHFHFKVGQYLACRVLVIFNLIWTQYYLSGQTETVCSLSSLLFKIGFRRFIKMRDKQLTSSTNYSHLSTLKNAATDKHICEI